MQNVFLGRLAPFPHNNQVGKNGLLTTKIYKVVILLTLQEHPRVEYKI